MCYCFAESRPDLKSLKILNYNAQAIVLKTANTIYRESEERQRR